jgi:hypothetical protein
MDQLVDLAPVATSGIGHNSHDQGERAVERHLAETYRDIVARFTDLELGCSRVPGPIESAAAAGLVTDFVAQCQAHIRRAESVHKHEKAPFLQGGRVVDAFFKRRCEKLGGLIDGVLERLKAYYDRAIADREAAHRALVEAAETEAERAAVEAVQHRAEAEHLACTAKTAADRQRAASALALADAAETRSFAAAERAQTPLAPVRIEGDYGAVAYLTHNWSFDVVDLSAVPRDYLTVNAEAVRAAIGKAGMRDIPGLRIFQSESLRVRGAV